MTERLSYAVGANAMVHDRACKIAAQIDIDQVLVQYADDGETEAVNVVNLQAPKSSKKPKKPKALDSIPDEDLELARERYAVIEPLLGDTVRDKTKLLRAQAEAAGVSSRTVQRWVKAYQGRNLMSDLIPDRRGKRKTRLSKKVEAIIKDVIETVDLSKQKRSQKKVIDAVIQRCKTAKPKLKPPHPNTIRARIKAVSPRERTKRREGTKAARDKYGMVKGEFPGADYPLAVVQIDHTLLDIVLVDDEERLPIGRPWLTLAVDVFSRMVVGMYVSLDAPSAFSVGMCMQHGILRKETYLEELGLKGSWPVWGIPKTLHADNGKDFRSNTLKTACEEYGINLEWRPVRRPEFGGHIERLLGTLAKEIHALPGTTFSNIQQRGTYDSDKNAVMTFAALERFLAKFITEAYHERLHRGIGMSPIQKWKEGFKGKGRKKGIPLYDPVADEERLRIDFLPYTMRTVQRDGIVWDKVHYLHGNIRDLIGLKKGGKAVQYMVRRDPRDLGFVYLLEPESGEYIEVPMRDASKPSISLWDLRAAEQHLKKLGAENIDEEALYITHREMEQIVEEETKTTRKKRRHRQRRKLHAPAQSQRTSKPDVVNDNAADDGDDGDDGDYFELDDDDFQPNWEDMT